MNALHRIMIHIIRKNLTKTTTIQTVTTWVSDKEIRISK